MPYSIEINSRLDKVFLKLQKKNPVQMDIITKKLSEIVENPQHYTKISHYP